MLFSKVRPGLNEKLFTLVKFRTMTNEKGFNGVLLDDALRLKKFGKFLRSTSLDELPELWNILKGEMSFVGPRPLLMEYLNYYNEEQRKRHNVRPGITGLAQVNGRNAISWQEKFDYDIKYAKDLSFSLDFIILLKTVKKVLNSSDIQSDEQVTMPKFTGNENIRS